MIQLDHLLSAASRMISAEFGVYVSPLELIIIMFVVFFAWLMLRGYQEALG